MPIFKYAYDLTNKAEGSYANDPDDKGGETYGGISRKNHPIWRGWFRVDEVKRQTSDPKAIGTLLDADKNLQKMKKDFYG